MVPAMNTFTDWISAYAALTTALLTFGLVAAAGAAYYAARDTLAQMREDSAARREDSARAARPYVHTRMVPSIAGLDTWDLIVQNTGMTAAHDLHLTIAPLDDAPVPDDAVTAPLLRLANAGLTVHPGERLRSYWVLLAESPDPTGFPPSRIAISYTDSKGTPYTERPVLFDPASVGLTPVPHVGSETPRNRSGSGVRNLENALRAVARNIGETIR